MRSVEKTVSVAVSGDLLQAMMSHPSLDSISSTLSAVEQYYGQVYRADPTYIEVLLMQMRASQQRDKCYQQKLEASINKLQTMVDLIQQYSTTAKDKLQWLVQYSQHLCLNQEDLRQEIQILNRRIDNLPIHQGRPPLSGPKAQEQELKHVLDGYRCRKHFPKNKTEMLILINQIEASIQQIQMGKAMNYQSIPQQ